MNLRSGCCHCHFKTDASLASRLMVNLFPLYVIYMYPLKLIDNQGLEKKLCYTMRAIIHDSWISALSHVDFIICVIISYQVSVSSQTVQRWLVARGLHNHHPADEQVWTPCHEQAWLQWTQAHHNWSWQHIPGITTSCFMIAIFVLVKESRFKK